MTDPSPLAQAGADADAALTRLRDVVARLGDGDLHRGGIGGGWTVAQVISHISLSTLLWVADLSRLAADEELAFFYREEIGHDAAGYPPPTVDNAVGRIASTRRTLATCLPGFPEDVLARTVEIPDLGTMTVLEWTPLIVGHIVSHVEQALTILRERDALPAGS